MLGRIINGEKIEARRAYEENQKEISVIISKLRQLKCKDSDIREFLIFQSSNFETLIYKDGLDCKLNYRQKQGKWLIYIEPNKMHIGK
jgi:hypothetical protein